MRFHNFFQKKMYFSSQRNLPNLGYASEREFLTSSKICFHQESKVGLEVATKVLQSLHCKPFHRAINNNHAPKELNEKIRMDGFQWTSRLERYLLINICNKVEEPEYMKTGKTGNVIHHFFFGREHNCNLTCWCRLKSKYLI